MRIVFTGGGSAGHFYPIISVAEELQKKLDAASFVDVELYYVADDPYDKELLDSLNITFQKNSTGKLRRYFSIQNVTDVFKTLFALVRSFGIMYTLFPDVVFSKGGYPSFPVTTMARFFTIPVVVHESDAYPGRANKIAGRFAKRIAVSYPGAAKYFPEGRVAFTGNPVRREIMDPIKEGSHEALGLDPNLPTILIMGGSQGAKIINDTMITAVPNMLQKYQIIHQVGAKNLADHKAIMDVALADHPHKDRYKMYDFLDTETLRRAAGVADLVVSRGGSTIFEISIWGIPSLIIPITDSNGDHQRKNAYSYAREGACEVIDESNLTPNLFIAQVERVMQDPAIIERMKQGSQAFAKRDAASKIADEMMKIVYDHYGMNVFKG